MLTRYFKSFLREFQKKRWTPTEQTRIIHDFIEFTMGKIPQCEPWSTALNSGDGTAADVLDMAREGLEKLVMTKLYEHTFRAVTSNDSALDRELALKMRYFRWVRAEHLDIPMAYRSVLDSATTLETALAPAMRELGQMNRYKAPRDKLVCVMNCCRLIMGRLVMDVSTSSLLNGTSHGNDLTHTASLYATGEP